MYVKIDQMRESNTCCEETVSKKIKIAASEETVRTTHSREVTLSALRSGFTRRPSSLSEGCMAIEAIMTVEELFDEDDAQDIDDASKLAANVQLLLNEEDPQQQHAKVKDTAGMFNMLDRLAQEEEEEKKRRLAAQREREHARILDVIRMHIRALKSCKGSLQVLQGVLHAREGLRVDNDYTKDELSKLVRIEKLEQKKRAAIEYSLAKSAAKTAAQMQRQAEHNRKKITKTRERQQKQTEKKAQMQAEKEWEKQVLAESRARMANIQKEAKWKPPVCRMKPDGTPDMRCSVNRVAAHMSSGKK